MCGESINIRTLNHDFIQNSARWGLHSFLPYHENIGRLAALEERKGRSLADCCYSAPAARSSSSQLSLSYTWEKVKNPGFFNFSHLFFEISLQNWNYAPFGSSRKHSTKNFQDRFSSLGGISVQSLHLSRIERGFAPIIYLILHWLSWPFSCSKIPNQLEIHKEVSLYTQP